jgi:hypothetical protein
MARYVFNYYEEDYGVMSFDAPTMEEASRLFKQVKEGEISYDELPNYSRTTKGGDVSYTSLLITTPALPPIPMLLKTGDN